MDDRPNAASVALIDGDEVLLIRRARPPLAGLWTLPGGRLEPGETAEQCATREIAEELGLAVSGLRPVMLLRQDSFVLQVFATDAFAGELAQSDEIAGWRWARADALWSLAVTPRLGEVVEQAIAAFNRR